MKKTSLYDWHASHGAKMVEFGGWMMPVSYAGVLAEHQAVRQAVGLFDISHMGEVWVEGPEAEAFLQKLTTNDVTRLRDGFAQYSLLLSEDGFVVDDIIVYRFGDQRFMLCVNASNTDKDFEWVLSHAPAGVKVTNASDLTGMLALQGPKSPEVAKALGISQQDIPRFHFIETKLDGVSVTVSRTGYTGEDGIEIFCPADQAAKLWEKIIAAGEAFGIQPIGLGARDTLRLEMAYPLYGHEISDAINPLEAGLGWVIKMEKGDFLGRAALQRAKDGGLKQKLVGLVMAEPGIPRADLEVIHKERKIGKTLSGTFSPSLQKGIATALVQRELAADGEILIDIRGKKKKARIVQTPFISAK